MTKQEIQIGNYVELVEAYQDKETSLEVGTQAKVRSIFQGNAIIEELTHYGQTDRIVVTVPLEKLRRLR